MAVRAEEADRFRVLILVLAYCGVRIGEATALRGSHVDLEAGRLNVARSATYVEGKGIVEGPTKNHERRSVPTPAFVVDELADEIQGKGKLELVFPGRAGGFLTLGELRWVFDPAAVDAGVEGLTPHDLRHTAASLAIAAGANLKVI